MHRSDGRFDMKVPEEVRKFLDSAPWMPAIHKLLGPDCVPLYDSAIVSVPGAKTQDMHCDNGHLFPHDPDTYCVAALRHGHLPAGRRGRGQRPDRVLAGQPL